MTDAPSLEERVARYLERQADAGVAEVAGALGAAPDVVAAVLDEDTPESGQDLSKDAGDRVSGRDSGPRGGRESRFDTWADVDWSTPESSTWPGELLAREQWMGHADKKPFAPWADRDHSEAAPDEDARWKWGLEGNYVDGETVAMAIDDPRLDGRAFLQQAADPYVYVDGDHVRDPETGAVHPAFVALLEHLGLTYADVSQSETGVHAIYRGDLPGDTKMASWQLDSEPWAGNDDLPSIEIYPGKRVCVMTGDHVPGSASDVREWGADVVEVLVRANDEQASANLEAGDEPPSTDRDDYDLDEYDPGATSASETTSDIRDVFAALERLDARRVAERTIVHRWNDGASTSEGYRAFAPTWGPSANGTANIVNDRIWQDTGDRGGYGGPVVMALIDAGEMAPAEASPRRATGQLWFRGVDHLRDLGFDVPKLQRSSGSGDADGDRHPLLDQAIDAGDDVDAGPESTLPLAQLDALAPAERRRAARTRGLDWPTTDEARDRLDETVKTIMRETDDRVVDAPTALGKSFTASTTRWGAFGGVTGDRPVVHLLETRDARDEAIQAAEAHGGQYHVLRSRHEACPVADGQHDPRAVHERDDDRQAITVDGTPASAVIDALCDNRGIPFSVAHDYVAEHNDQGVALPCGGDQCDAVRQWDVYREGPEDGDYWPLVIATHNFAYAPGLRMGNNVVIDELPDYRQELSTDRIRRAVTAYLQAVDAPVTTWEALVSLSRHDGLDGDAAAERDALADALDEEPEQEWYLEAPDAHVLAPALARAVFFAEERSNGRRAGKTVHEPPRLEAGAREADGWNREWLSVVLDESNEVRQVRCVPDLSAARSVVGLDAHPSEPVWQANSVPWMGTAQVLAPEERRLWRRYERGLRVVQVGEATRPLSGSRADEWLDEDRLRALIAHLREAYGQDFRTAITTAQVEDQLEALLAEAGIHDADLMHYGAEKSRNDFAGEAVGLVNGCMDPGDDYVVDLLAELDLEAAPETAVDEAGAEYRQRGRGFEGPDAEAAAAVLESVRANHVAQAAGRYARNADDDSTATAFVRTDAAPPGFVDVQVPGVQWTFSGLQRDIVDELRSATGASTTREVAEAVGCSKEHVRQTLTRLEDEDVVQALAAAGEHGATTYADDGVPNSGVVDTANGALLETTSRWSLAIRDADVVDRSAEADTPAGSTATWDWKAAATEEDPPD